VITVSEKSRSAVVALIELAQHRDGAPVPILEVADARGIPLHLVEQLFSALRRAGILQSQRGVKGGYLFRRPPEDVTVLDVVETVDGRLADPADGAPGGSESVWADARTALAGVLGGVTIADLVEREARLQGAPMFHI
jgi:Rrf2 family transcriptional regulator, cysteine metabolism repressor